MSSTITEETVSNVAKLARLELNEEEVVRYQQDLTKILALVEQLNQLDLEHVNVSMTLDQPVVLREDEPQTPFERDVLLKNAPLEEEGFFRVPQILETN